MQLFFKLLLIISFATHAFAQGTKYSSSGCDKNQYNRSEVMRCIYYEATPSNVRKPRFLKGSFSCGTTVYERIYQGSHGFTYLWRAIYGAGTSIDTETDETEKWYFGRLPVKVDHYTNPDEIYLTQGAYCYNVNED